MGVREIVDRSRAVDSVENGDSVGRSGGNGTGSMGTEDREMPQLSPAAVDKLLRAVDNLELVRPRVSWLPDTCQCGRPDCVGLTFHLLFDNRPRKRGAHRPIVDTIILAAAAAMDVPEAALFSRSKNMLLVVARAFAAHHLSQHAAMNPAELGRLFRRDRTSMINARKRLPAYRANFADEWEAMTNLLRVQGVGVDED